MQISYLGTETGFCGFLFDVVLILTTRWRPRTGIKPSFYKPQNKKQPLLGLKYYNTKMLPNWSCESDLIWFTKSSALKNRGCGWLS